MIFPDNALKGIPNPSFMNEEGNVGSHLFRFDIDQEIRDDDLIEQSINWEDDYNAIDYTLKQKKENGETQFKVGVAIVPREDIDRLMNKHPFKNVFFYERNEVANNPYHGNLLLNKNISKPTRNMLSAGLALAISKIVPQTNTISN